MSGFAHVVLEENQWRHAESPLARALWCALLAAPLLLVVCGMLALAALSRATAGDEASLVRLEYSRLDRFAVPTTLKVQLEPAAVAKGEVRLLVSHGYLSGVRIRRIEPSPARMERTDEGVVFVFAAPHGRLAGVQFQVEGVAYGGLAGTLAVADGPRVPFKQYLLP